MSQNNFSQDGLNISPTKLSGNKLVLLMLIVLCILIVTYVQTQVIKKEHNLATNSKVNVPNEETKLTNKTNQINYIAVEYTKPSPGVPPVSFLKLVSSGGASTTIISYSNENIYLRSFSPDYKYVVINHYNRDKHGSLCLFCEGKTGLAIIRLDASPYEIREVVPPGLSSQSNFSWSLDGKYLSYSVNETEKLRVMDVNSGKIVAEIKSEGMLVDGFRSYDAQPIFWFDQENFSYILDGNLYLGSVSNPQGKIIGTGVDNSVTQFEGSPTFLPPDWSPGRKYVSYFSTSSLVILNTVDNKQYKIVKNQVNPYDYGSGGEYIPETSQLGWRNDNEYLFYDVEGLRAIILPEGKITTYLSSTTLESGFPLLSRNTDYVYTEGSKRIDDSQVLNGNSYVQFKRFFSLSKANWDCTIEDEVDSKRSGVPFVDNRDHTWVAGNYALLQYDVQQPPSINSDVHVIDLNLCKKIGIVPGIWPTYESVVNKDALPSVLDIVTKVKNY